jgi:asparagine synthase (glutamine-hydrolysing)
MCGITGAFAVDGSEGPALDRDVLERMTESIRHRGPDDAGLVLDHSVALGARRLSIVDVEGGHQPMANEDGRVWGAQNGEIYNHGELREALRARGHSFRTRCDTEVLAHLWEEHGPRMCEQLRGKYGIAVWDSRRRVGLLARDRLGIKPLYYAEADGLVVFGSELKAVITSGLVDAELDLDAIASYLTLGFIPAPLTPLAGVRKLMPGEYLIAGEGKVRLERYWSYPSPPERPAPMTPHEAGERLLEALDDSVEARLMSDVPLGAMLSGGLDSSLIVALMARHMDEPVKTFSVGFTGDSEGNELADARRVAESFGTSHHELELPLSSSVDELSRLAWHMDEPLADLSALGFTALCELAARHVTVALSGQGADELLGGYRRHRLAAIAGSWHRLPSPLRAAGSALLRGGGARFDSITEALQARDPVARMIGSIGLLQPDLRGELYSGALAEHAGAAESQMAARLNGSAGAVPLEAAMYLEAQLGLVDDRLHYFDRASMAWSLEVRVPFLDHRLVELCASFPPNVKANATEGKRALRRAARGLVPDFVLDKRKLGFFSASVGGWLDSEAGALVDELLLADAPRYAQVVDPALVRRLVGDWRAGARRHSRAILALVMLELWLRDFLPRAFAGVRTSPERALVAEGAA